MQCFIIHIYEALRRFLLDIILAIILPIFSKVETEEWEMKIKNTLLLVTLMSDIFVDWWLLNPRYKETYLPKHSVTDITFKPPPIKLTLEGREWNVCRLTSEVKRGTNYPQIQKS